VSERPLRAAILPPAPAHYREPLFEALAAVPGLESTVIYQSAGHTSWDAAPGFFATEHRYPAQHLGSRQRARPGRSPIVWPVGLERALSAADPDVVVAVEYGAASLRALRWCRTHRRGFVILSDCTPQIDALLSPVQLALHRVLARHAERMIVVSSAGRQRLERFGVPAERIVLAPQAGALEPMRAAAALAVREGPSAPAPPPLIVLSAGRLVPDKNFATLISAVADADPTGERLALEIAGTGSEQATLRALAAERGIEVTFYGAVAPAEMAARYAHAHVFALVSTFEPFGVVIREAVAAGLPILAGRNAGAAGDVARAGENAILVDPTDVPQISAALLRLADDDARRARMAAASRTIDAADDGADVRAFTQAIRDAAPARHGRRRAASLTE
jgi:glycosyltransferase involved in cell wall biosynthesis